MRFIWDVYSDQPYPLKNKALKKIMRFKVWPDHLKVGLTNILVTPLVFLNYFWVKQKTPKTDEFFGLGVNIDREPDTVVKMVNELGVDHLLIRFPLCKIDQLESYLSFVKRFQGKKIVLNLLQSRDLIENPQEFEKALTIVFRKFAPWVEAFQVANAVNRTKWGFFSIDEYLRFYQVAYQLKKKKFREVTLIGPSVIDFEFHLILRALFHLYPIRFEKINTLLYVDRRGAPEKSHLGLNLQRKIKVLASMLALSPRAGPDILITETNWPITGTSPYAPTSENECVAERVYTNYMVRYYLLALATGYIKTVYWHQLIAPGYGLVDNREGIRKRGAYKAFYTMIRLLKGAKLEKFEESHSHYTMLFVKGNKEIEAHWSLKPKRLQTNNHQVISIYGESLMQKDIELGEAVVYVMRDFSR